MDNEYDRTDMSAQCFIYLWSNDVYTSIPPNKNEESGVYIINIIKTAYRYDGYL